MTSPTSWDRDPVARFGEFVLTVEFAATGRRRKPGTQPKPLSAASATVYKFMFGKFAAWIASRGKRLSDVDHGDLKAFLALESDGQRDLNSKIAYRYLRLLERCFDYLQRQPNPAAQAILGFDRGRLARDAPMTAVSRDGLQRFVEALPAAIRTADERRDAWKARRDRAMQLVMALAGLRVAEAIGLLVEEVGQQVRLDGSVELSLTPEQKHATSYPHKTVLPAEGVAELHAWLRERATLGIPGRRVFPSDLDGRALNKTTVYRKVRATFERAELQPRRTGGRTLRNTFALQRLEEGTPPAELKQFLGVAREESAAAYRHARPVGQQRGGA